jgi:nitrite reductase/ring-hydroxylating ferredoxin subunit
MQFVDVCAFEEVPAGRGLAVRVSNRDVALFYVAGVLHAIENSCLHAGASLAGGKLCGRVVTCPAHGWRYDVTTGAVVVAPSRAVATFPVRIADGRVLVGVGPSA